jgi:hypothetical protein
MSAPPHLTFVVYEEQRPALCYQISKKALRWFTVISPLMAILVFSFLAFILFLGPLWKELASQLGSQQLSQQQLQQQYLQLDMANKRLRERYEYLQKKWIESKHNKTAISATANEQLPVASLLKQNEWPENLKVIDVKLEKEMKNWKLSFNFQNTQEQKKISGSFFVLFNQKNALQGYPTLPFTTSPKGFSFHPQQGEFFQMSRFRPVNALFPINNTEVLSSKIFSFVVFIFDKSGKYIGNYPIQITK